MKITKFGHSCLLVEEGQARILIDPGNYSVSQNETKDIDVILITHEHNDHCDLNSIKQIVAHNPAAIILTNQDVGKKLVTESIAYQLLEDGDSKNVKGVLIEAFGKKHAVIFPTMPPLTNTGYLINKRLYHPGDALNVPSQPVEILALPVCASWLKISEAVDYGKTVRPRVAFPIHDGMLKVAGGFHKLAEQELIKLGTKWFVIEEGKAQEF